ncbi:AI-2E family transporter [Streptomyces sp. N2-109]|uniref:AI-2E family transporter n=1 Tax=Streptomyces gossypii TaxID=2883101 RepID=A0ABT2JW75_9ACTN|nr:AI-2E family transporter [Streptomyces gossypii]MCT2591986.1 AI-2E family transporter [Streptomyces gossypii]
MAGRVEKFLYGVQRWAGKMAERKARAGETDGSTGPAGADSAADGGGHGGPSGEARRGGSGATKDTGGAGDTEPPAREPDPGQVPAPPAYAPAIAKQPEPATVVPWGLRVAAEASWRLLVLAGVIYVLMQVVSAIGLLIMSFSAGLLITALMQPTVARLRRLGLGRGLATAVTFITGFVIMGLVGWFVVWQVMENLPTLTNRVQDGIVDFQDWAVNGPFHVSEEQINDIGNNLSDWLGDNSKAVTSAGLEGVTVVFEFLSGALLAMFVTLFLLYDGPRIWQWTLKFVPASAREGVAGAGPRAWITLTGYVRGTVIVAFIDAFFIGIGIYFLDVPMAVPLAVFIFLFAFIPIVGAVMSGALAVVVALVTNGVVTSLLVLAVVLVVQQLESHVLQPFILGRLVRVHPLGVVLGVTGGSLIAGIPGAVVAVPLVAVTNTVVGYLRVYAKEQALRQLPGPHGATALSTEPVPAAAGAAGGASPPPSPADAPPARGTGADGTADAGSDGGGDRESDGGPGPASPEPPPRG